jgi:hypothetical protein
MRFQLLQLHTYPIGMKHPFGSIGKGKCMKIREAGNKNQYD